VAPSEKKPRTSKQKAAAATKKIATRARRSKTVEPGVTEIRFEHVAERAYYLWLEGAGGDPAAHWFQAERELAAA
jgi:hypothetical protein